MLLDLDTIFVKAAVFDYDTGLTVNKKNLTINSIESLYNLKSSINNQKNIDVIVKTSIFSNFFLELVLNKSITDSDEIILNTPHQNEFPNLKSKIYSSLAKKRNNIYHFYTEANKNLGSDELTYFLEIEEDANEYETPIYCRPICRDCSALPKYTIEQLNSLGQVLLNLEFKEHSHPLTRKINGKFLSTNERKKELINHYIYAHSN